MICKHCGSVISDEKKICSTCGSGDLINEKLYKKINKSKIAFDEIFNNCYVKSDTNNPLLYTYNKENNNSINKGALKKALYYINNVMFKREYEKINCQKVLLDSKLKKYNDHIKDLQKVLDNTIK
jgi:hypothetical protein